MYINTVCGYILHNFFYYVHNNHHTYLVVKIVIAKFTPINDTQISDHICDDVILKRLVV